MTDTTYIVPALKPVYVNLADAGESPLAPS